MVVNNGSYREPHNAPILIRVTSDMCPRWIAAKYTIEAHPVRKNGDIGLGSLSQVGVGCEIES